jgi:dienelactone hydrolase
MATGLLLLVVASGTTLPLFRISCGILAALLVAASLGFSWALPMFQLPRTTGKYPVGTRTLNIIDPVRKEMHSWAKRGAREVVVQLWYPAASHQGKKAKYRRPTETTFKSSYQAVLPTESIQDAPVAEGRFPVIVHNPAWHGARQRGSFLAQELASQGFVVAAVSHPYNSSFVEMADGSIALPDYSQDIGFSTQKYIPLAERLELAEEELAIQTEDCRMMLDELERLDRTAGHPLEGRLKMENVGSYGHSFGGAVSAELAREDKRVLSVVELDGVLHGAAAIHGVEKPILMIDSNWLAVPGSSSDGLYTPGADARAPWRIQADKESQQLWQSIAAAKTALLDRCGGYHLVVDGLGHSDFTDQIFMSPFRKLSHTGPVPPKRVAAILNAYLLAFFQQTLLGEPSPLLERDSQPFAEATIKQWIACN